MKGPTLHIDALAYGGKGVGRHEGKTVFVPGTVPGDLVTVRVRKEKKRYIEGEVLALIEPAAIRRAPPCPVFGRCGGCQWQFLPYEQQVRWKECILADFLVRQVGIPEARLLPFLAAPAEWNYRSRMQFKCRQTAGGFMMGFYRPGSHYVIDIASCPIAEQPVNRALAQLRPQLERSSFSHQIPQVDLAVDDEGQVAAVIHYIGSHPEDVIDCLGPALQRKEVTFFLQQGRKSTLTPVHGSHDLHIHPRPGGSMRLAYPVGGFAQINLAQNRRLVDLVLHAAGDVRGRRILDLFCGMGNFSLPLAAMGAEVMGVEDFPPAIERARANALAHDLRARFICSPAEEAAGSLLAKEKFDIVVLDPPRSGAYSVVRELVRRQPSRIIYISCDPATLARDLKPLVNNGYQVSAARGLDFFPQTYHIESFVSLELK